MKVCLDAGHGITTAGKQSIDGSLREYEFNRDVVSRIKNYLENHGIEIILTAPTDEDISLTKRVNISNIAKADIFVSIHANAYGSEWNTANGWEIYHSQGSVKGKKLADYIHKESVPFLGLRDRGIKTTTDFTVVRQTIAPAVLIEHGFMTNKAECELLKSDEFREKCAIADAKGILKYFNIEWKEEPDYKAMYESLKSKLIQIHAISEV